MFLVVSAMMVVAQPEETSSETSCSGFWGYLKCFFSGDTENQAGKEV